MVQALCSFNVPIKGLKLCVIFWIREPQACHNWPIIEISFFYASVIGCEETSRVENEYAVDVLVVSNVGEHQTIFVRGWLVRARRIKLGGREHHRRSRHD